MANSSGSSDESCKAPENFHVFTNDDDCVSGKALTDPHSEANNVVSRGMLMECPLCCTQQKRFHCRICVKNGYFTHSSHYSAESLSQKQQKFISLQAGLKLFSERHTRILSQRDACEIKRNQIDEERNKIAVLKDLIARKRDELQQLAQSRAELHMANVDKGRTLPNYPSKVKGLEDFVLDRKEKTEKLRIQNDVLSNNLKIKKRNEIQKLVENIFPISEVMLKDESRASANAAAAGPAGDADSATIAALADAKNTSYIRGKWVIHGSGISEMQYRIVAPSLPANGDYSAYLDWLTDNKDEVPKAAGSDVAPSRVTGFRIAGALTFTTQLTNLMSFYLNVRLPHKVQYGDFCKKLNEDQFLRKVSRLNINIFYMAYIQKVNVKELKENHTLENLMAILDLKKSDLGYQGHQDVANAPITRMPDTVLVTADTDSEDEGALNTGWEAVPNLPSPTLSEVIPQSLMTATAQQASITDGIANRITSLFFRWNK